MAPRQRRRSTLQQPANRIVVPVRFAAWLAGDLGASLEAMLARGLAPVPASRVSRLPRALLVEAGEEAGPLLEAVRRACGDLEASCEATYPAFYREMGPVWTGTLQAVFAHP